MLSSCLRSSLFSKSYLFNNVYMFTTADLSAAQYCSFCYILTPIVTMIPVLWDIIKYDDHDIAEAIILTEETMNAVVDEVRGYGKDHG